MNTRLNRCNQGEQLVTYLYDESTSQEAKAFEGHLEACGSCREELDSFGALRRSLETWQVEQAPRINLAVERSPLEVLRELFISDSVVVEICRRGCSLRRDSPCFACDRGNTHQLAGRNGQLCDVRKRSIRGFSNQVDACRDRNDDC